MDKVQQPWLTRGFNFKEQLVLTTEMERRINLLNEEMVGYMKEIKLKVILKDLCHDDFLGTIYARSIL